ncbi:MAG: tetratricopeptide repeat protein, partial [Armatimonadetes bacterium]|nr:tetratricopeptide repeat protein [Armatimonadota bacterium]
MQETTATTEGRLRRYAPLLVGAALVLVTLASYRYVFRAGFVFDDAFYLVRNAHVRNGLGFESVKWALRAFYGANWHPLTWLSSMLDYRVFGDRAAGHHAVNLLFHIVNSVLLLVVLRRMTGSLWRSAFVAALFALHPLHVESVAWLSERKDVLSAFFMLAAMWAYVGYADRPGLGRYALVTLAFALGLMSKPMLVSLPILLLMLDCWPLRRVSSLGPMPLLIEKLPLFALSIASGVITYLAQRSGEAVARLDKFPFGLRAANALTSYVAYIWKTLYPAGLAAYYPYPKEGVPALSVIAAALLLAAVTLLAVRLARSRPYLIVGWLWYVVSLIPVIGLVQVGEQAMADRYMYIPMIGLGIVVAWGVPDLLARPGGAAPVQPPVARGLAVVSAAVLLALAAVTSAQVRHWESDYTLFRRVVEVAPGSALAHSNYGLALAEKGEYDKAIEQYGKALDADPTYVRAYFNLGNALKETGRPDEAVLQFREALRIDPNYTDAKVAAANVMVEQGDEDAAAAEYEKALEANPNDPVAHY